MEKRLMALLLLVILLAKTNFLWAQSPQKFSYQAIARDKNGDPVADKTISVDIRILQGSATGSEVFKESHQPKTNNFGLFTLEIGSKTALSVNWSTGVYFMETKIDATGGTNFDLVGTVQLLSVPYALYADRTKERQGLSISGSTLSISETGTPSVTLPSGSGGGDNWGTQVVVTTPVLSGKGTTADPLSISPQGASNGQVLQWNGTAWLPGTVNISGGDGWGTQVAKTNTATISGDGTPTKPLDLVNNAVTSDKILDGAIQGVDINQMNATDGQVLKWSQAQNKWIPQADNTGGGGTGGDNWGTQTTITNATLSGNGTASAPLSIAQQNATDGQVLKWSQAQNKWIPQADNTGSGGTGGDNWGTQTAFTNATLTGNGTASTPLSIAPQNATSGQVLKWNGSAWLPANDDTGTGGGTTYTAGSGISIVGNTILNTGDLNATNELQSLSILGNQLSISSGNTVTLPTGTGGTTYTAGTGISITGTTITNTGDNDNSATNEIQTLSLAGNSLTLSNGGGTVTLPTGTGGTTYTAGTGISITGTTITNTGDNDNSATNEIQTLSLAGNSLTLSNGGGTVTLPTSSGGTTYTAGSGITISGTTISAADVSASNELQTLSISGNTLSISNGNSVTLPSSTGGTSQWNTVTNGINYTAGNVGIGTGAFSDGSLTIKATSQQYGILVDNPSGNSIAAIGIDNVGNGVIVTTNSGGTTNLVEITSNNIGAGLINTYNSNAKNMVQINTGTTGGYVGTFNNSGNSLTTLWENVNGDGYIGTFKSTGGNNVAFMTTSDCRCGGYIGISNNSNVTKAGMYVNSNGQGYLFADVVSSQIKNFKVPHPKNPNKDIWYASIEGPEAGMYERGTATLTNGEAFVPYSETFEVMLSPNTATVNLTPQYWDTYGLAVVEKTDKGFKVKELKGGTGNFIFDWEVKAVRKGYEDYKVVRDKEDLSPAKPNAPAKTEDNDHKPLHSHKN